MKISKLLLVALIAPCAVACTTPQQVAQARGAHDLGCTQEEAVATEVPGVHNTFSVTCKDQKATYVCISTQTTGIVCDRDG